MNPSSVQLASPIRPPPWTADQFRGRLLLVRREHHAEGRQRHVEGAFREGECFRIRFLNVTANFCGSTLLASVKKRTDVVGRRHARESAGCRECGVAIAGCDIKHIASGAHVDRLAKALANNLEGRADNRIIAGRPDGLLALLNRREIRVQGRN